MHENEVRISLFQHNIDTILSCLCAQIEQQAMIDMYRASLRRLEDDIVALKMKYEPMTDEEVAEIG